MPYDENGDWYQDEIEVNGGQPLSPQEIADQEGWGGQLQDATNEYYSSGLPDSSFEEHPGTNWFDQGSTSWLTNTETPTAGPAQPTQAPTPGQATTSGTAQMSGGGGDGGSLLSPYPGQYQRPNMRGVVDEALGLLPARPEFTTPEIPQINPWSQPKWDDIYQDQSYLGRKKEGEQALMNSKAAQGLVRTGGTLKDLLAYNQDFAGREYGNISNRSLEGWRSNTDATLRRSGMEQDRARSLYEPQFAEYQNKVNTVSRAPQQALDQSWREYLSDVDLWRDQRDSTFDKLGWLSTFDRDSAAL